MKALSQVSEPHQTCWWAAWAAEPCLESGTAYRGERHCEDLITEAVWHPERGQDTELYQIAFITHSRLAIICLTYLYFLPTFALLLQVGLLKSIFSLYFEDEL